MSVYWLRAGNELPTKVGYADDAERRRQDLQVAHWLPLKLLRVEPGDCALEHALHRHYGLSKRVLGEWFILTEADIWIDLATVTHRQPKPPRALRIVSPAAAIINELGGYRTVADALKLSRIQVHNWTRRGIARQYWPDVVALATRENKTQITFDALKASMVSAEPKRAA